jgi:uncharacterized membrane protein YagU involved in acid resistance
MKRRTDHRLLKGLLAGAIGGLVASWTMNQFQFGLQKLEQSWKKSAHQPPQPEQKQSDADEDATMKTADRLFLLVNNRHLSKEEKRTAGPVVHYMYGTVLGGIYGLLAEFVPVSKVGFGTGYASAAWFFGDEIAVPVMGLAGSPWDYPLSSHAKALASHVVYGATTEAVRKAVRAMN